MRIKTSRTLKSIENWKNKVHLANHKYLGALGILMLALGYARLQATVISMFIIGVSLNFALVQLGYLLFIGLLLLKLQFYRFANLLLAFPRFRS